tara:strand:- start:1515 stop:1727 length:213 start_codon:yes stop_codon:yes gene_type:complete
MTDKNEIITIDDTEYKVSDLSEQCRSEIQSLSFTTARIQQLKAEIAVAETASNAYKVAIADTLPKKTAKH